MFERRCRSFNCSFGRSMALPQPLQYVQQDIDGPRRYVDIGVQPTYYWRAERE